VDRVDRDGRGWRSWGGAGELGSSGTMSDAVGQSSLACSRAVRDIVAGPSTKLSTDTDPDSFNDAC
jgi:hypothetical protein